MYQKLTVIGRATDDGKAKKAKKSDVEFSSFGIAVDEGKETTFFDIVAFGKLRDTVAKFVKKGRVICVEGKISRGNEGYFNVIANRVVFLDSLPKMIAEEARTKIDKAKK